MKTEEQDNGDLLIILEPEELKKLGWEENDTINIVDNKNGTITLMKKEELFSEKTIMGYTNGLAKNKEIQ